MQHVAQDLQDRLHFTLPASGSSDPSPAHQPSNGGKPRRLEIQLLVQAARTRLTPSAEARISELLSRSLDWDVIVDMAGSQRVVPLLYRNLSQFSQLVPVDVLEHLRVLTLKNSMHNLYLAAELSRLVELMERNGIASLPFKGPVLASRVYEDLSLRQFTDLDILIAKQDISRTKELFVKSGYLPAVNRTLEQDAVFLKARRPYNYKFISANGTVHVELHWEFTSRYNSFPVDYKRLFERLVPIEFAGRQVSTLKPEDLLVLLCQHGSKHFWARLFWLVDIVEVVRRYEQLDWDETITRAEGLGARRMLFLGLHLAERLFDLKLPAEVSKRIRKEPKIKTLAARIEDQLFLEAISIEESEGHSFSWSMRERLRDRLRYSGYRALGYFSKATTPTQKDREALPQSLSSSGLAYVIRPFRLILEGISGFAKDPSAQSSSNGEIVDKPLQGKAINSFWNYNGRLAMFRPEGNDQLSWETRWSKRQLRETLESGRSGRPEEFDRLFSEYLPRELPVLEAGCGLGQLVAGLDARGYQVEGVDYAEQTISRIREVAPDLNVRVGDVYNLDAPDSSYGGYISIGVFEHNPDGPLEGLEEVRRVLTSSGVALISIPYLNKARKKQLLSLNGSKPSSAAEDLQFYQYYYSREEFEAYLRQAGLEVIDTLPYGVYAGMTRDLPLGKWLGRKNFFFWQFHKRFLSACRHAPRWARWRWAHMLMFVCQRPR